MTRIEAMNASGEKRMLQHLVARVDDLPGDGRPHDRRPRRAQARARVHLRVDGRPQAGRVRADAAVPRPRRHRVRGDEPPTRRLRRSRARDARGRGEAAAPETDVARPTPAPRRAARERADRRRRPPTRLPTRTSRRSEDGAVERAGAEDRRCSRRLPKPRPSRRRRRAGGAEARVAGRRREERRAEPEARPIDAPPAPARRRAGARPRTRRDRACRPVVRAQAKYVRSSARKARLVCDHIRGKSRGRGASYPRSHAACGRARLEQAARVRGRERRAQPRARRRGPRTSRRCTPTRARRSSGSARARWAARRKIRKRTSHLTILLTPKD